MQCRWCISGAGGTRCAAAMVKVVQVLQVVQMV